MMRFVLNVLGSVLLALALVFAVSDIARSLAKDIVTMTPLAEAFGAVGLSTSPVVGRSQSAIDFIALVSTWPAAATIAATAFLLLFLGRSRRRPAGRVAR